jgi:hypothetical protein
VIPASSFAALYLRVGVNQHGKQPRNSRGDRKRDQVGNTSDTLGRVGVAELLARTPPNSCRPGGSPRVQSVRLTVLSAQTLNPVASID